MAGNEGYGRERERREKERELRNRQSPLTTIISIPSLVLLRLAPPHPHPHPKDKDEKPTADKLKAMIIFMGYASVRKAMYLVKILCLDITNTTHVCCRPPFSHRTSSPRLKPHSALPNAVECLRTPGPWRCHQAGCLRWKRQKGQARDAVC